jgi:hypothetical protein
MGISATLLAIVGIFIIGDGHVIGIAIVICGLLVVVLPYRFSLACPNGSLENIGVLSIVVPKLKFSNVQMQIFPTNFVVSPNNAALEDRPEAFNRVGVDCANDVLSNGMIDGLMWETPLQPRIAGISVGSREG